MTGFDVHIKNPSQWHEEFSFRTNIKILIFQKLDSLFLTSIMMDFISNWCAKSKENLKIFQENIFKKNKKTADLFLKNLFKNMKNNTLQ